MFQIESKKQITLLIRAPIKLSMFLQRAIDQFTTEQQTDKFGKHHIKSSFEEMTNLIEKSLKET